MKFKKYPSLTNHYAVLRDKTLMKHKDDVFYATEKIHGANISIIMNRDSDVVFGKRTTIVTRDDENYSYFSYVDTFIEENKNLLQKIALEIFRLKPNAEQIHLYGELFGSGIQKMDYNLNKDNKKGVRFFNIITMDSNGNRTKLSYDVMLDLIPIEYLVPYIDKKPLIEFLKETYEIDSKLGGYSEGLVYQKYDEYEIIDDHFLGVKRKFDKFLETSQGAHKSNKEKATLASDELAIMDEIENRITPQRLKNILSHGDLELTDKNIGLILKAMESDIASELEREVPQYNPELHQKLVKKVPGKIVKIIKDELNQVDFSK